METRFRPSGNEGGFTLVELMMVIALISIITPAITYLFSKMSQGMAADEMRNQMVSLNETTVLRIHERLLSSRHMCQGDVSGTSYLAAVTTGMSAQTKNAFPILTGSLLPISQPVTSFAPAAGPTQADFGNSLLFGAYDCPEVLYSTWGGSPKLNFTAPVSIFSSGAQTIAYANGAPATQVVDLYRFYFYYLTKPPGSSYSGLNPYRLIEWQSIQYADYNELAGITDGTLLHDVCTYLTTAANFQSGVAITNAWDPTQATATGAFYTISAAATLTAVNTAASITEAQCLKVTRINSGILSTGFTYGVCPNTLNWTACPITVPEFCTTPSSAAVLFPGGFETGISGTGSGMEVLVRSVLAAKGGAKLPITNDSTMISNVKDIW